MKSAVAEIHVEGFYGRIDGEVNTVNKGGVGGKVEGMINMPFSQDIALRVVGFYEKYGIQTRVAYTHRGEFLAALVQTQQQNEPVYTEAYGQLDMSASYDITKHFSVFFDAINLTGASQRQYGRYTEQFLSATEGFARYQIGFRAAL